MTKDLVFHLRIKYIEIHCYFTCDQVDVGLIKMEFCSIKCQVADRLAKV